MPVDFCRGTFLGRSVLSLVRWEVALLEKRVPVVRGLVSFLAGAVASFLGRNWP